MPTHDDEVAKAVDLAERADLLMVDGDSVEARRLLEEAVRLNPANEEAQRMLRGLLARQGAPSPETRAGDLSLGHDHIVATPTDGSRIADAQSDTEGHWI
jgi:hypothetical protein